ncbi:MAG: hypothetical protein BWY88_00420 [Synergistetes bacterium ADurb.Bin520]|nr:MAG: hypothetical protein BWY88_00420 [Synergistetes bacterium ADurb.Bin520]
MAHHFPRGAVEEGNPRRRSHPQAIPSVLSQGRGGAVGQDPLPARRGTKAPEGVFFWIVAVQPLEGGDPQDALFVPHQSPHDIRRDPLGGVLFPAPDPKGPPGRGAPVELSRAVEHPEGPLAIPQGGPHRQGARPQAPDVARVVPVDGAPPRDGIPAPEPRESQVASQDQPPSGVLREAMDRHIGEARLRVPGGDVTHPSGGQKAVEP